MERPKKGTLNKYNKRLVKNRIMVTQYLGGSFDNASSWTTPQVIFDYEGVWEIGRIVGIGEPTKCQYTGKEYLYFS